MQRFPNIQLPTVGVHHFMLIGVIGFIGSCSPDRGGHNYNKNQRPVFHVLFSSLFYDGFVVSRSHSFS